MLAFTLIPVSYTSQGMVGPVNVDLPLSTLEIPLPIWYKHFDLELRGPDLLIEVVRRRRKPKTACRRSLALPRPSLWYSNQTSYGIGERICT